MTVAGQPTVTYGYDNANRLTSVTQATSTVTLTYDDGDRRSTLTLPTGIVVAYAYDNANQLTNLNYSLGQTTLGSLIYTYDLAAHRTEIDGTWARTELPAMVASASYDAANRLTEWGGNLFGYDANGNVTSQGFASRTWSARNQLTSLSGAVTAGFQYDGVGRRQAKTLEGATTSFLYDGANIVQELTGGASPASLLRGGLDETFARSDVGVATRLCRMRWEAAWRSQMGRVQFRLSTPTPRSG